MSFITLMGLDAQNPLAFFASLGLLRIVDDYARLQKIERPKLCFTDKGYLIPILYTSLSFNRITEIILEDARNSADNLALQVAYNENGERVAPTSVDAIRDLKPPLHVARAFLTDVAASQDRRAADLLAGFFCELISDNNGNTKPTSFHFTAGQQTFLSMVESLRTRINAEDVEEALIGPWKNSFDDRKLPSLSWDSSVSRAYALRASDPSKDKKGTVAAANWLAVQGLAFFPVSVQRGRLQTTGVKGGWKDSVFQWPVWEVPAPASVVASLLLLDPAHWYAEERQAIGVIAVFSSSISRSDQGGYGSFHPPHVFPLHQDGGIDASISAKR